MDSQLIISIGREFGSAGHEIAQHLAEHYNIPLLDSNLLNEVALEKNLDIQKLQGLDEKNRKYGLYRTVRGFSSHPEDNVAFLQFDYLRKKAEKGDSFVVVGRCSEDILKEYDALISIFILGDMECKKARIKNLYNLSDFHAAKLIKEEDMKRKHYHNSFCEGKWGDSRNYDISINSSKSGVENTTKLLIDYINLRLNEKNK